MSLTQKTLSGFIWTFSSRFGTRITTLGFGILMARLLTPADFGLIAMVAIFFEISDQLVSGGFMQALIRQKKLNDADKSTTFFINLFVSLVLFILIWFFAPFIARFFDQPQLIYLTRIMALRIPLNALIIVQKAIFYHSLKFKVLSFIEVGSILFSGIIGLYLAYSGYGVKSLAIKYFLGSFFTSAVVWAINPWKPIGFINRNSFNTLFGFGSKLMLSSLVNSAFNNIYNVIIGKFFSATILGFYNRAHVFIGQTLSSVLSSLEMVTYPVLSKVVDSPSKLISAQKKIISTISFVNFPLVVGLGLAAKPFIEVVLGEAWMPTVPFMQVLCISALISHLGRINRNLLKVVGRSDLFLMLTVIEKTVVAAGVVIGIQFGIWGLLIASVISQYITVSINVFYLWRLINFSIKEQLSGVFNTFLLVLPMALVLFILLQLNFEKPIFQLALMGALGVMVYFSTAFLFKSQALSEIIETIKPKINLVKKCW